MARGPNVALFKKIMALFKSRGAKKRSLKKIWAKLVKKHELMALTRVSYLIFPFFGPPTTKGWRPLLYSVIYSIHSAQL